MTSFQYRHLNKLLREIHLLRLACKPDTEAPFQTNFHHRGLDGLGDYSRLPVSDRNVLSIGDISKEVSMVSDMTKFHFLQ